jgi:hypothetical protein
MKVPGWDGPIRCKRHGETTSSPKLIEKLRSRFSTAPTIVESVRRPNRKATAPTIRYAAGGPSFAAVAAAAAAGEEPPVAGTPEGKKRRKEPTPPLSTPVISEAGTISNPAADITAELRNTIKQLTGLMTTIRQEVEDKITALTVQVQQLQYQSLANSTHQRTEQSTASTTTEPIQQPTEQATLERAVHSAVTAALGKITADISDITSLLQDRDARISDEIQGLRDELSEVSQQARPHTTESTATYHTPQTTPRKLHQYGKKDFSPHHKRK